MVATGIPRLETIRGGALPAGDIVLLLGAPGTVKAAIGAVGARPVVVGSR